MTSLAQAIQEGFEINEAKTTAASIVKAIKNDADWGDFGETIRVVKGNIEVADTFFYGQDKAMQNLKDKWSAGGDYAKTFKSDFGVDVEIIDTYSEFKATSGWYKKISGGDGIVSVTLKIK